MSNSDKLICLFGVLPSCNYIAWTVSDFFVDLKVPIKKIWNNQSKTTKLNKKHSKNKKKIWEWLQASQSWQFYYNWMAHFNIKTRTNGDAKGASLGKDLSEQLSAGSGKTSWNHEALKWRVRRQAVTCVHRKPGATVTWLGFLMNEFSIPQRFLLAPY